MDAATACASSARSSARGPTRRCNPHLDPEAPPHPDLHHPSAGTCLFTNCGNLGVLAQVDRREPRAHLQRSPVPEGVDHGDAVVAGSATDRDLPLAPAAMSKRTVSVLSPFALAVKRSSGSTAKVVVAPSSGDLTRRRSVSTESPRPDGPPRPRSGPSPLREHREKLPAVTGPFPGY